MRILLNATSLATAGGLSVGLNFLHAFSKSSFDHEVHAFVPRGRGYEDISDDRVRIHVVPGRYDVGPLRFPVVSRWLVRQIHAIAPDVVFSMGNIALPTSVPQLLLFHWAYAIYPESVVWERMDWRSYVERRARLHAFRRRLRFATAVAVQTETARARMRRLYGVEWLEVIPNAVTLPVLGGSNGQRLVPRDPSARWTLLCLTRYYPHKNLEVLVPVARKLEELGSGGRILLTLAADQHPRARSLLRRIEREGLGHVLVNIGPVPMSSIASLYSEVDGLLLPTLLESFSGTYVEAMHYGVPVFTSDMDFARDVCGDAAVYFDPKSPESIVEAVMNGLSNGALLERLAQRGRARVDRFPGWLQVCEMYVSLLERIGRVGKAAVPG